MFWIKQKIKVLSTELIQASVLLICPGVYLWIGLDKACTMTPDDHTATARSEFINSKMNEQDVE